MKWQQWQQVVCVTLALVLAVGASAARADVLNMGGTRGADGTWTGNASLEFTLVDRTHNANDNTGYGGVNYKYAMSKYEVTAAQYTEFLNKVAATDTYGLYNTSMTTIWGCRIQRSGVVGSYTYSVPTASANRPVNFVNWADAARFVNWLQNGQPTGAQDPTTTEAGVYALNGANTDAAIQALGSAPRAANAMYWLPSENEWYKAAYYDPNSYSYWNYPTGTDTKPKNTIATPDPGNNANFYGTSAADGSLGPVDSSNYLTTVGQYENSESPFGTYDQAGNIMEWTENGNLATTSGYSGMRGGHFYTMDADYMNANNRMASQAGGWGPVTIQSQYYGFRVATVPEPGSLALFLCGALVGLLWWRKRR